MFYSRSMILTFVAILSIERSRTLSNGKSNDYTMPLNRFAL
jgi:hypothetical protein